MTKKEQTQFIITGCLILILVFAMINGAKTMKKVKLRRERQLASQILVQDAKTGGLIAAANNPSGQRSSFNQLEEQTRGLGVGRDPFTLRMISSKSVKGESLSGIIWDDDVPMAVINGQILTVGDSIGGNTLVDIKEESVVLSDGTNQYELKLGQ